MCLECHTLSPTIIAALPGRTSHVALSTSSNQLSFGWKTLLQPVHTMVTKEAGIMLCL